MMRCKLAALVVLVAMSASSCSLYTKGRELIDDGRALVGEVKQIYAQAKADADTDGNGRTSKTEWFEWAAGGGLAALITAILAAVTRNGKSNERKAKTEAKVDEQDKRLGALESMVARVGGGSGSGSGTA